MTSGSNYTDPPLLLKLAYNDLSDVWDLLKDVCVVF